VKAIVNIRYSGVWRRAVWLIGNYFTDDPVYQNYMSKKLQFCIYGGGNKTFQIQKLFVWINLYSFRRLYAKEYLSAWPG